MPQRNTQNKTDFSSECKSGRLDGVKFICHNVSNAPKIVDEATADTAIFLILAALCGFDNGIMAIRNGAWPGAISPPPLGYNSQVKILGSSALVE
ncbi:hypothetical protein N7532_005582 [Penicillium argentinense]|uniref:Uncharacterized protein n=1 Tax=Penicillium argentinense TaxID=1131581 RepID=A0A9W9KAI3_9EURO|nr:uncharacterized protein N7532_005582 [Penicillium argentinense]KAJ5098581.1 hypothetical protein N7532_005582 [Penicillium argentinense]